jgi:hypothetical protein
MPFSTAIISSTSPCWLSRRLQYHWIALVSKGDLSGKVCACRLSIRSFAKAAPNGTGSRAQVIFSRGCSSKVWRVGGRNLKFYELGAKMGRSGSVVQM